MRTVNVICRNLFIFLLHSTVCIHVDVFETYIHVWLKYCHSHTVSLYLNFLCRIFLERVIHIWNLQDQEKMEVLLSCIEQRLVIL